MLKYIKVYFNVQLILTVNPLIAINKLKTIDTIKLFE